MFNDFIDAAAAGASAEGDHEVLKLVGLAGGEDFDRSVVGVADPAVEAELGGFAMHEPAESDALDAAFDEEVLHHDRSLSQGCGGRDVETRRSGGQASR